MRWTSLALQRARCPRHRTRRENRGAAQSIEAAVITPLMLLTILTAIQFGTLVYARQMAEEAARYGVRQGVVNVADPVGGAMAAANDYIRRSLPWGGEVTVEAPGGVVGSTLRIRVTTRPPNLLGPVLAFFGGGGDGYTITAIATGRMEGWQP